MGSCTAVTWKPASILFTAEGTPKVADFGLARHVDGEQALTLSGTRIGTPSYMAPEQVIGKAGTIGPAADIYAAPASCSTSCSPEGRRSEARRRPKPSGRSSITSR